MGGCLSGMRACLSGLEDVPGLGWCVRCLKPIVEDHNTPIIEASLDAWQDKTGMAAGVVKHGGKFLELGFGNGAGIRWVMKKEAELGFRLRGIEGVDESEQTILQAKVSLGLHLDCKELPKARARAGSKRRSFGRRGRTGGELAEPMISMTPMVTMTGHSEDGARIRLVQGSPDYLEHIPSGDISAVFNYNCMYFWQDVPGVLAEVMRVLAPGGEHMTVTRMQDALMKRDSTQPGFTRIEQRYVNTDLTKYQKQLQRAGFEVISVEIVPGVYEGLMTHERVLARKPMTHERIGLR
eukprot:gb/GEZN01014439.1/.p1 GENE.gb/GEZN01014439.1/~~gb/GEZN01014439.1/.p1  ORF type:complete len:295 (-),score=40.56 gb/GEZN01014439.1/:29-913(-)